MTVAYCHCRDCRRWTGAPIAAFAAFTAGDVTFEPALGPGVEFVSGVRRWACARCGSPLAATFSYLPGQAYVPVGLFDNAEAFAPRSHSHVGSKLSWLHLADDLPRSQGSGRDRLNTAP